MLSNGIIENMNVLITEHKVLVTIDNIFRQQDIKSQIRLSFLIYYLSV